MKNLEVLILRINKITEIKAGIFKNLSKLNQLYLRENPNLTTLNPKAFYDLPSLEYLDLSQTGITEIKAGTFENLPKLNRLTFQNHPNLVIRYIGFI